MGLYLVHECYNTVERCFLLHLLFLSIFILFYLSTFVVYDRMLDVYFCALLLWRHRCSLHVNSWLVCCVGLWCLFYEDVKALQSQIHTRSCKLLFYANEYDKQRCIYREIRRENSRHKRFHHSASRCMIFGRYLSDRMIKVTLETCFTVQYRYMHELSLIHISEPTRPY